MLLRLNKIVPATIHNVNIKNFVLKVVSFARQLIKFICRFSSSFLLQCAFNTLLHPCPPGRSALSLYLNAFYLTKCSDFFLFLF